MMSEHRPCELQNFQRKWFSEHSLIQPQVEQEENRGVHHGDKHILLEKPEVEQQLNQIDTCDCQFAFGKQKKRVDHKMCGTNKSMCAYISKTPYRDLVRSRRL